MEGSVRQHNAKARALVRSRIRQLKIAIAEVDARPDVFGHLRDFLVGRLTEAEGLLELLREKKR